MKIRPWNWKPFWWLPDIFYPTCKPKAPYCKEKCDLQGKYKTKTRSWIQIVFNDFFFLCNLPLKKKVYVQKGLYSEITWSYNKNVNQDLTLNPSVFFLLLHWVTPTQFPKDHSENPSHKTLLIRLTHDLFFCLKSHSNERPGSKFILYKSRRKLHISK